MAALKISYLQPLVMIISRGNCLNLNYYWLPIIVTGFNIFFLSDATPDEQNTHFKAFVK